MNEVLLDADDLREMVLRLAHEVKNPLATILSAAQLMTMGTPDPDELQEYVGDIVLGVRRIDGAIRDLRRYVQLQVRLEGRAPVARVVDRTLERLGSEAGTVLISRGPEVEVVPGDEERLVDALAELVQNAVRFSPPDVPVEVGWKVGGGTVDLWVRDGGTGVPEEVADRLFRPFFSTSTTGTGLGLTLARRIVEAHRGKVWWENLDSGCRFVMSLPARAPSGCGSRSGVGGGEEATWR